MKILKKGFLFSLDAFLAAILLIGGFVLLSQSMMVSSNIETAYTVSEDFLVVLNTLKPYEIDDPWVQELITNEIIDPDQELLTIIGTLWADEKFDIANNLTKIIVNKFIPADYQVDFYFDNDMIFNRSGRNQTIAVSRRMISGIAKGEVSVGSTGTAHLKRIRDKRTSAFAYFGGFFGQGNMTVKLNDLPLDANVTSAFLEIDAGSPFDLYINGNPCGSTYVPNNDNFTPDLWELSCLNEFSPGVVNLISINFSGLLNQSYIAGGFLKIQYKTDQLSEIINEGFYKYDFPEIKGVVNLYDAFLTPGSIKNISLYLHFNTSSPAYLTIGDSQVYSDELSGERSVTLNDVNLTNFPALLNYDFISNTTVPLRFASYNNTYQEVIGSNADIVLITDTSGSMGWRLDQDGVSGNKRACSNPDVYHKNDTERLTLATCLDIEFTEVTMNESLSNNSNRQWLVDYAGSAAFYTNDLGELTKDNLINEIETYKKASGGTCISCALNLAYDILDTYSNENRSKFVVIMTDGIPTYCTDDWWSCDEFGTGSYATYWPSGCIGDTTDCNSGDCDGPINNAINSGKRLYDDLNASVYTIGIGPVTIGGCTASHYLLETVANYTNGSYYSSKDSSKLQGIYHDIASNILLRSSQVSQFVNIKGELSPSILYGDSHINITYEPVVEEVIPNEITLLYQSPQFNSCNPNILIYPGMRVIDSKMTSYSDYHWTDSVVVNGVTVFNLSDFDTNYIRLGDPYLINILPSLLVAGNNQFSITTGDSPGDDYGCSDNNSLIMTVGVNLSTTRSSVLSKVEGCNWNIEFEDSETLTVAIPGTYTGGNNCSYNSTSIIYDSQDAYQVPVYELFRSLDFDNNGRIIVNLEAEDLEIIVTVVNQVPYLWGPASAKLVVGK